MSNLGKASPRVYVIYSHDSDIHDKKVLQFSKRLRGDGINVTIDAEAIPPGAVYVRWAEKQIKEAEFVLVVCTSRFVRRFETEELDESVQVEWDGRLIRKLLYDSGRTATKVVPIIFGASDEEFIPTILRPFKYFDVLSESAYEMLLRFLFDAGGKQTDESPQRMHSMSSGSSEGKLGELFGVPELPFYYHVPARSIERLRAKLLDQGGYSTPIVVEGVGGIGKSVIAAALARDETIRRKYIDGVFWITSGGLTTGELIQYLQQKAAAPFGLQRPPLFNHPDASINELETRQTLFFHQRSSLIVLDDYAGEIRDILSIINSVGPNSRILVTTRRKVDTLRPAEVERIVPPVRTEALDFLATASGVSADEMPPEAEKIVELCGNFPLALAMVGALIRTKQTPIAWKEALKSLEDSRSSDPNETIFRAINESMAALSIADRERFLQLSYFGLRLFTPGEAAELWKISDKETRDVLQRLSSTSLIRFDAQRQSIEMHEMMRAFLAAHQTRSTIPSLKRTRQSAVALAADSDDGEDCLGIKPEVEAFSSVLALKDLKPPLCLGIFGDWGTGKTFFMKKMQSRIAWLCKRSEEAEERGAETVFCCRVAQITFNAWHYVDANLWASLACRIFEGLDEFISQHSDNSEAKQAELFRRMRTAQEKLKEAETETAAAKTAVQETEDRLERLEEDRREKTLRLEDVRTVAIERLLTDNVQVRKELEDAAKQIGLEQLAGDVTKLEAALTGFRTVSGRVQAICLALFYGKDRWWRVTFLVAILALPILLGPGLEQLLAYFHATGITGKLAAALTQVGGVIVAISIWIVNNLRWASGIVDTVDKARQNADTILREARAKVTPEEAQLQKELTSLKQQKAAAQIALKEALERVSQAEREKRELEARANGKMLAEFIREKVSGSTYQKELGLISTIRKDLHALNDLLTATNRRRQDPLSPDDAQATENQKLPRIDRIVLYIDDLDRCPEEIVVQVLQAVHLLLAFPLFIVVLGVDSRWLLRSLRHQYAAFRGNGQDADLKTHDGGAEYNSTPQHYLEKIIQVPFNLRRMDSRGFQRLMEDILPYTSAIEFDPIPAAEVRGRTKIADPQTVPEEPKTVPDKSGEHKEEQPTKMAPDLSPRGGATDEEFDLVPKALVVTQKEVDFMAELVSLIPTPRAAKRLGNVYRLIRAGIAPDELTAFLGTGDENDPYRTVIALLAVQIGFPLIANHFFKQICANAHYSWTDFRTEIGDDDDSFPPGEGIEAGRQSHLTHVTVTERARLNTYLDDLVARKTVAGLIGEYDGWIKQINRYSFRGLEYV